MVRVWIVVCLVVMILAGCGQSKDQTPAPVPDYTPFLTADEGDLQLVALVKEKVQEETKAVNDMVAAMAGRFTPVIYDVQTEEGKKAVQQLQTEESYPAYFLFNNQQLLAQGHDLAQIAQAAMDYTDRLSIGG
ncbi:hypothetical protein [Paenibacillus sp. YAF4_2]|uniref:hypothetical protein n=1 Tax=Paenibacillus sp. YAF4_2 TaxID=3233085 RepID=UPI003F9897E9